MDYSDKAIEQWMEDAEQGRIYIHADLDDELGMMVASALDRCDRDNNIGNIVVDICSPGGRVAVAFQIADRIRSSTTHVTTICSGMAFSGAFLVLAAGDHRRVFPHSMLMFHGVQCFRGWGTAPEMQIDTDHALSIDSMIAEYLSGVTKKRQKHWQAVTKSGKDRYVTVEEALEWGVVDEIV